MTRTEIIRQAWIAGWVAGVTEPGAPRNLTKEQVEARAAAWWDEFAGKVEGLR